MKADLLSPPFCLLRQAFHCLVDTLSYSPGCLRSGMGCHGVFLCSCSQRWILDLPSHRSRVVAPILGYFASDRLVIPSQCCCFRCCPFSRSKGSPADFGGLEETVIKKGSSTHGGRVYATSEKTRAGESPRRSRASRCFRCMYTWLLELFACTQFCLLSSLQNEILHIACRYINRQTALFA